MTNAVAQLKRSHVIVGGVRAIRGLVTDLRVLVWVAKRNGRITSYLKAHPGERKLQLATSNNVLEGWMNTDVLPSHDSVIYLDATRPFPFESDTFGYIMAEHMIEHIGYEEGQIMLRECFRVLKFGGRLRIATPDLRTLLALHSAEKTDRQRYYVDWAIARLMPEVRHCKDVFVINNAFRAWGHCFLYDEETLRHAMQASGFRCIKFYKPGQSDDRMLKDLECHGREIGSEEINQFETIVAEGKKEPADV
jgi:predicted SAM-dependent methyltransferase